MQRKKIQLVFLLNEHMLPDESLMHLDTDDVQSTEESARKTHLHCLDKYITDIAKTVKQYNANSIIDILISARTNYGKFHEFHYPPKEYDLAIQKTVYIDYAFVKLKAELKGAANVKFHRNHKIEEQDPSLSITNVLAKIEFDQHDYTVIYQYIASSADICVMPTGENSVPNLTMYYPICNAESFVSATTFTLPSSTVYKPAAAMLSRARLYSNSDGESLLDTLTQDFKQDNACGNRNV